MRQTIELQRALADRCQRFDPGADQGAAPPSGDPHSMGRFRALLRYERARTDRNGSPLALVVLRPLFAEDDDDLARQQAFLAETLAERLRLTDEVGRWDDRSLGVLLPDTPEQGAWKVAGDILDMLDGRMPLACEVYVYPSDRPPPADDEPSAFDKPRRRDSAGGNGRSHGYDHGPSNGRRTRPLETMFIQPLPKWKRLLDIVGAVIGMVLLSPLMLVTAVAIKLTSPGPIFFHQRRDGLGGQRFMMIKFRTMRVDAQQLKAELRGQSEQDGPAFKLKKDPRVTPLGRYLRRTCIDELPQLWHVLRGEMSLVGPRPLDSDESQFCSTWQRRRLDATPGLTCIWQVYGKVRVSFNEWMRMDIRYIASRSFWQDMKLIFATLVAVIRHRGSH